MGNGTPPAIASLDSEKPATPANANCASDVWPANPDRITNDSASTVAITVVMMAARHSGPRKISPPTASATGTNTDTGVTFAGGTEGSFQSSTDSREGNRSPARTMTTMMMRKGRPSRAP